MAFLNISIALSRLPLKGQVSGYSGHCLCADWQPSVNPTFEPRWFPSFHRQSHIYCRSQWPYWWGLNPRQGLVSIEAVTNWTAADQWATATIWVRLFKTFYIYMSTYPLWTYVVALSGSSSIHLSYISSAFPNCCWSVKAWKKQHECVHS